MADQRTPGALHIGRLAGIPIGIQPMWVLIVAFITYAFGHDYFPAEDPSLTPAAGYVLGLVSALGLFGGIVLHELGHAIVARRRGMQVDEIDLWLLGGVARIHGEPKRAEDELAFAAAGPAVTAVLLVLFGALRLTIGDALPAWGLALLDYQVLVTAMVLGFNLLPAFPLDGGRIARALLWRRLGDADRATALAAPAGRAFGWGFVGLGVLSAMGGGGAGGLWLVLVGGFLVFAGKAEAQQSVIVHAFGHSTVGEAMTSPAVAVASSLSLATASEAFARHLFSAFPVVDEEGRAIGVLTIDRVRSVPASARIRTNVRAVAIADPALLVEPSTPVTELFAVPAFARVGRAVVVGAGGEVLGIVSITDLQRRIRADEIAPPAQRLAA